MHIVSHFDVPEYFKWPRNEALGRCGRRCGSRYLEVIPEVRLKCDKCVYLIIFW